MGGSPFPQRLLLVPLGLRGTLLSSRLERDEDAAVALSKIDLYPRSGDEQAPASGAEEHRHGVARTVHVALPARLHRVERAAAIELNRLLAPRPVLLRPRTSLAHSQHRVLIERKGQRAVVLEDDFLHELTGGVPDDDSERVRPDLDAEGPDCLLCHPCEGSQAQGGRWIGPFGQRGVDWNVARQAQGLERDAKAGFPGRPDIELRGFSCRRDCLRLRCPGEREEQRQHKREHWDVGGQAHTRRSVAQSPQIRTSQERSVSSNRSSGDQEPRGARAFLAHDLLVS